MSEATLLLLGEQAEALAPRLEASGYSCVLAAAPPAEWRRCHLALLAAAEAERIPALRQALPGVPLLLDLGRDGLMARSQLLRSGATDFWLSALGPSDLLVRLRLHLRLLHKGQPSADRIGRAHV